MTNPQTTLININYFKLYKSIDEICGHVVYIIYLYSSVYIIVLFCFETKTLFKYKIF